MKFSHTGFLALAVTWMNQIFAIDVGHLNANNDHGFWFEQNLNIDLSQKWAFNFHAEERWGNDYKTFWYAEYWTTLQYNITDPVKALFCSGEDSILKLFSLGPGFAQGLALQNNTKGVAHWSNAYRTDLIVHLNLAWKGWQLKQRIVGEYWNFTTKNYKSYGYYRHRALLFSPWEWTCLKIKPYLSDEWFVRATTKYQAGSLYENRFRIGALLSPLEHLSYACWFQLRSVKQLPGNAPSWNKTYYVGLTVDLNY